MKSTILIVLLVLATIFSVIFSGIKASEAEMQTARAEQLSVELDKIKQASQREAERAERMAAISVEAETRAKRLQGELEKCQSGK